jgi:hypothetical protein
VCVSMRACQCVRVIACVCPQVLYQYFVGVSSRQPFWKLDIPCGQLIVLVPRLFGFEERRVAVPRFGPAEVAAPAPAPAAAMHMASHWE